MSYQLSSAAIAAFDAMVKHAYASRGHLLRDCVRVRTGVVGSTHKFPKMGQGAAHLRGAPQTDVVPMNVAHSGVTATLADYEAPEYTDIFSQQKVNYDEKAELAQVLGDAMGRLEDQIIINALVAGTFGATNSMAADVGGANTNLNVEKVYAAAKLLGVANVPSEDRVFIAHENQKAALLTETPVTSSDYNSVKALVNGQIDTWMGFKWKWLGDRTEGGLPMADADDRKCYAFHKMAVGLAEGIAQRTSVDWIPHKTSWLSNAIFSAGAVTIDQPGVIQILCDDDAVA